MNKSYLYGSLLTSICLAGCMRPQPVVTAANLTANQLALMKVDATNQMDILAIQRSTLEQETNSLKSNARAVSSPESVIERDWRASGSKEKLEILSGIRQNDVAIRADPFTAVRINANLSPAPSAVDLSGLDKALAGISRLSGSRPFDIEDIKPFAIEIVKAYQDLKKQQDAANAKAN